MGRRRMSPTGPSLVTVDNLSRTLSCVAESVVPGLRGAWNQFAQVKSVEGDSHVGGDAAWLGSGSG